MYAAIPRVELSVSRSESVSAPTVSGSVICITGNGVYTSHCGKHTTLVDPEIDAWYIVFFIVLNFVSKLTRYCPE